MLHKVEKALMLETDVPETPNEVRTCDNVRMELIEKDDLFGQKDGSSRAYWCLLSMFPAHMPSPYVSALISRATRTTLTSVRSWRRA